MSELKPKFKVNEVVRAEWEGKSIKAKIIEVNIFEKLNFVGYKLDTDQFFREEELSTDTRVGDIVKSEFNGVISLATKTGTENANVVEVECANNGSFRLCTDLEIKQLSQDDFMEFICKDKYPDVSFKVGDFVAPTEAIRKIFNGIQEVIETRKEQDSRILYLISDNGCKKWCCSNDIKKWIPKVNEKVVINIQLAQINPGSFHNYCITRYYTVIMKVKEVLDNTVLLEDYSSAKFEDLTPLSKYKGN